MLKIPSLEKIKELNGITENPLLGIVYGSREEEKDLDLFLLYPKKVEKSTFVNNYDFNQIDKNNFKKKLYFRDIEYTEPIITGEYFMGNEDIIKESRNFLFEEPIDLRAFDYLKKRGLETFLQSKGIYNQGKIDLFNQGCYETKNFEELVKNFFSEETRFESEIIKKSLSVLSYTFSYFSSIERYRKGQKVTTINQILDEKINSIEETFSRLKEYYKSRDSFSFNETNAFFKEAEDLLKKECINLNE